ncbi:TPA: HNH endonuclease [Klebsiella pneumoniae]
MVVIHGEWPASFIDHINLNRSDNRAINLRLATNSENMMNQSKRADNSSGVKGVDWHSRTKKWRARCMVSGVRHTVGMFNSKREAEKSIREFRNQVHGEFANHGVES